MSVKGCTQEGRKSSAHISEITHLAITKLTGGVEISQALINECNALRKTIRNRLRTSDYANTLNE
jgi:hypothetical protein